MTARERDGCSPLPAPLSRAVQFIDHYLSPQGKLERKWLNYLNNPDLQQIDLWIYLSRENANRIPEKVQAKAIEMLIKPFRTDTSKSTVSGVYYPDPFPPEFVEDFSPFQTETLATLLPEELTLLRKKFHHNGQLEDADRIEYYQNLLIILLPKLPVDKAEKLFEAFDIRDVEVIEDGSDYSGYRPLERLLMNPNVSEEIKIEGIGKIHFRSAAECRGEKEPRVESERAHRCHRRMIEKLISQPVMPVTPRVIETMVSLLSCANTQEPVVEISLTEKTLQYVMESMNRVHFIEQQMPHFEITSKEQAKLATRLFREFRDNPGITDRLAILLNTWQQRKSSDVS